MVRSRRYIRGQPHHDYLKINRLQIDLQHAFLDVGLNRVDVNVLRQRRYERLRGEVVRAVRRHGKTAPASCAFGVSRFLTETLRERSI